MRPVTIYTTDYCGFCYRAKALLQRAGIPFVEHDVTHDTARRAWLRDVTGQRTVPQIFFGDESIGGCEDLEDIIRAGALDARLRAPAG